MFEQIRSCVDIWTQCIDNNPAKRPTLQHIVQTLSEMGSMDCFTDIGMSSSSVEQVSSQHMAYE
jgi:hypothetical protein